MTAAAGRSGASTQLFFKLVHDGLFTLDGLITHEFVPRDCEAAYALVSDRPAKRPSGCCSTGHKSEGDLVIKLAHVCIESADLDATERFYACLGLRRQFEFRNPAGLLIGFYLRFDDETFLEVIRVERVRAEGVVRHFAIESDDIECTAYTPARRRVRGVGEAPRRRPHLDGYLPRPERRVHRAARVRHHEHAAAWAAPA